MAVFEAGQNVGDQLEHDALALTAMENCDESDGYPGTR
jgi:hypothetical protein